MSWFLILLIILVVGIIGSVFDTKSTRPSRINFNRYKPYYRTKLHYYVKGIWVNPTRIDEYRKLKVGDIVSIRFDENNKNDANALGVYSENGVLLGYIRRDEGKLIKSYREKTPNLVKVVEHEEFFSKPRQLMVYRLGLEVWIGFPQEELEREAEYFVRSNKSYLKLQEYKTEILELRKKLAELKKEDPFNTIMILKKISLNIIENNKNVQDYSKIKIPFVELIDVAYSTKDFSLVLELFDQFSSHAQITERQMEGVLKRVEKAEKMI